MGGGYSGSETNVFTQRERAHTPAASRLHGSEAAVPPSQLSCQLDAILSPHPPQKKADGTTASKQDEAFGDPCPSWA